VWEEIFIAEGSDWFWWFGEGHFTYYKEEFDRLFRQHLKNVYKLINVDIPRMLDVPIFARADRRKPYTLPKRFSEIKLDGVVSNYFEWMDAGKYNVSKDMDTMHRTSVQPIYDVYFGFDIDNLFIRGDFDKYLFHQYREKGKLVITFVQPFEVQIHTSAFSDKPLHFKIKNNIHNYNGKEFYSISMDKIIELSCPLAGLGFIPDTDVEFFIELVKGHETIQRVPLRTALCVTVPSKDFERIMWHV
jgi:hypothetical protein